jgi:hypothetical protein
MDGPTAVSPIVELLDVTPGLRHTDLAKNGFMHLVS